MKNKVVVITGASSGIGASLARLLSSKGARTVLLARRTVELERLATTLPTPALVVTTDVTKRDEVNRAIIHTIATLGHIDVVVNNAGRGINQLTSQLTDDDLDEMMAVNVKSVLYVTQAVLPHFRAAGKGHIINISSMLARVPFAAIRSAYAASKAAMVSLSANLRMELSKSHPGIAVSCIHPGVVATDFGLNVRHGGPDSRTFANSQTPEEVAEVIAGVIREPRADVYTRPGAKELVLQYLGAEDMGVAETLPPFAAFPGTR